jgi:hypothetical protein
VEGRSIEGLSTSLSIALTWKLLSDAKKGKSPSGESYDVLTKWLNVCNLPEDDATQGVEKVIKCLVLSCVVLCCLMLSCLVYAWCVAVYFEFCCSFFLLSYTHTNTHTFVC